MATDVRRVAIIGGGLVGSLAAIYFARRGWDVSLFELRMALSVRGLSALKKAGFGLDETVLSSAIPMKGRMIHSVQGKLSSQLYGSFGECINSVGREALLESLLNVADELRNVKLFFEHKLTRCDFDLGELEFENQRNGSTLTYKGDLIVGADGVHSTVRAQMMHVVRMNFQQEYIPHMYCELTIPPKITEIGGEEFAMDSDHLHIWPRHTFMMIALPNRNKSFTCTLFMPHENFESIKTEDDLMQFFQQYYPDAIPLIGEQNLKQEYFRNPKGALMSVKCYPHNYKNRAIIIGDAAHSMVPFYGQGMNCGFQDVELLNEMLDKYNVSACHSDIGDNAVLAQALDAYTEHRFIDATTICDLAMYNYIEMRSSVVNPLYLARKTVEGWLHFLFPNNYIPLYTMVSFSTIRYSEAWRRWRKQRFWSNVAGGSIMAAVSFGTVLLVLKYGREVHNTIKSVSAKVFTIG